MLIYSNLFLHNTVVSAMLRTCFFLDNFSQQSCTSRDVGGDMEGRWGGREGVGGGEGRGGKVHGGRGGVG